MDKHWFKSMAELLFILGIVAADDKEQHKERNECTSNWFAGHCESYY